MPSIALKLQSDVPADAARQIREFLRGFSLEAAALDESAILGLKAALPGGTDVYLTAIPGRAPQDTIETATRLRALGLNPIPHVAARPLASRDALDDLLAQLVEKAGVRRILAVAGDFDRPLGPFDGALDVIESGLLQRHGIAEVGIAGYPEGHPRIAPDALGRALAAKIAAAEQTGLAVHIVTQFAFGAGEIVTWLRRLRDLGIEQPVRIGMAGPANLSALLRYARRCGVRASAQGLTRNAGLVKHLIGWHAPDGLVRPLAEACAGGRLGRVAAHFYSFGGAAATARWAATAAAGRITLDRGDGFRVEPP
jgi:methylenetetrahydrofolate reductase (NADPH)